MSRLPQARAATPQLPATIGARYQVLAQLGRGGSAHVYHAREIATGREFAIKRLRNDLAAPQAAELTKHLEQEFYALAQLHHPRVIAVYDYGVSEGLPYYTMELLDGGDLRASSPLPWRRASELIYDVASSLALLHSRRFVHRDVTPSNIRCTRDGRAKLIDFGAMVQMGAGASVIGTPAFVAPEVQQRGVLDACTDLFSLGATLYFTVTGRPPFAAADLAGMAQAWTQAPLAPSRYAPEVPSGFDALVLSLLSIEPALRPRSAFEVMQRLAALAGLNVNESVNVSLGYLAAPHVVGRDAALRSVRRHVQRTVSGTGSAVFIEAESGMGRTRLLELCTLEAKTTGACVLRLHANDTATSFAGALRLADALLAALPELARAELAASGPFGDLHARWLRESDPTHPPAANLAAAARPELQDAFTRLILALCQQQPLVIAVDDVQRLDEPTLACLATLAHTARHTQLLIIATASKDTTAHAQSALGVLRGQSSLTSVLPLTRQESDTMFATVFGNVPNLALVSERIFAQAHGNPRASLALAQYLVDQGSISYAAGAWSLPESLPLAALPVGAAALFSARLARLDPLARKLAETQALSLVAALRRDDYQLLIEPSEQSGLEDALSQLLAHEVVHGDTGHHALAHRGYAAALEAQLTAAARTERHAALARWAEQRQRHPAVIAYHRLHAGHHVQALELLAATVDANLVDMRDLDQASLRAMLERALALNAELGRPRRERVELVRSLIVLSMLGHHELYALHAPELRAQLEADNGWRAYAEHAHIADPNQRLQAALIATQARYEATSANERVYTIQEALRISAIYCAQSIAVYARSQDIALLAGLPALLEPFVALSPLIAAVWQNVEATCDVLRARPERGVERWLRVYDELGNYPDQSNLTTLITSVAYGLGRVAAGMGQSAAALHWIELFDRNPLQRVNAMRLRGIVCLQHGDWAGAERAREQAELMALQGIGLQLFEAPMVMELYSHWLARNLAGVKQTSDRIGRFAAQYPGWVVQHRLAQGYFDALRGDAAAALISFEACIAASEPKQQKLERSFELWLRASAAAIGTLLELERVSDARNLGERVLAQSQALEIVIAAQPVACQLALAEAHSGNGHEAVVRLDEVIADQLQRGVSGLQLGASYEARARAAISLHDHVGAMRYADLAAREYRHGVSGNLNSRYGQLLQEARRAGLALPAEASEPRMTSLTAPALDANTQAAERALAAVRGEDRAQAALELLCKHGQAAGGHLYVSQGANAALVLAATLRTAAPSPHLTRFAEAFWQQQLEDAQMSAVLTELPWSRETHKFLDWVDPAGTRFSVLMLYNARAEPAHTGLVLLCTAHTGAQVEWPTALLSTVALQLSAATDARCAT